MSIPWSRLMARCAGEASPGASSPVDKAVWKSAQGVASVSFYQSGHMLGTHVVFFSEWMGGTDGGTSL